MDSYPTGQTVVFPYGKPYPQQVDLMNALLKGLAEEQHTSVGDASSPPIEPTGPFRTTKILCLESPTGTGKSLSLACSSLAWLEYETRQWRNKLDAKQKMLAPVTKGCDENKATSKSTGIDWLDAWQPDADQSLETNSLPENEKTLELEKLDVFEEALSKLRSDLLGDDNMLLSRRENMLRQAITKRQMQLKSQRRRLRKMGQSQEVTPLRLEYEDHEFEKGSAGLSSSTRGVEGSPVDRKRKWNRDTQVRGTPEWMLNAVREPQSSPTSTLQPPEESLPQKHHEPSPKIIYAARTHSQLSQFISEVRKTKWGGTTRVVALGSRSQGLCGYLSKEGGKRMSEAAMTEHCLDLRSKPSTLKQGGSSCQCPYYQPANISTLALHSLAVPTDIEDLAVLGKSTRTCAYYASRRALDRAELIVLPYAMLVDAKTRQSVGLSLDNSVVLIDEAHNLPAAVSAVMSCQVSLQVCQAALDQINNYTNKYINDLSARNLQLLGQLKTILTGFIKSLNHTTTRRATEGESETNPVNDGNEQGMLLYTFSEYLCQFRLQSINLYPILRYMAETKLSQKLLGFMGDTSATNLSRHISPMSVVEKFLVKWSYETHHTKIVIRPHRQLLELVVLNPAVNAEDDLYNIPRAVCLVGGTLQPLHVLMQELVPSLTKEATKAQQIISAPGNRSTTSRLYESKHFTGFSCGHVVSPNQVLLQTLTLVRDGTQSTRIDVRHKARSTPSMCNAIGLGLLKLSEVVPHGLVVFVPSYSYEQTLVTAWKTSGLWKRLEGSRPIFREPKQASQMDATLEAFSEAARGKKEGGLLLSVIGGKLSEGINFADDLCRCVVVVGLPYADKSDPILQEKLKLVQDPSGYYQALCMRAVNQSVGRAIRHARDHAAIVLMDFRYQQDIRIAESLPQWLTASTPGWRQQGSDDVAVIHRIRDFFQAQS
eukprot:Nitzschia sp. Nitz4//scaffold52_size167869//154943//157756//NITZ4_002298-RA/size167869-processed-gene-0.140-mRNA-1//-1//CDS//3329554101//1860//frame0